MIKLDDATLTGLVRTSYENTQRTFDGEQFNFPQAFREFGLTDTTEARKAFCLGVACALVAAVTQ
jgi:hypothetical protein